MTNYCNTDMLGWQDPEVIGVDAPFIVHGSDDGPKQLFNCFLHGHGVCVLL